MVTGSVDQAGSAGNAFFTEENHPAARLRGGGRYERWPRAGPGGSRKPGASEGVGRGAPQVGRSAAPGPGPGSVRWPRCAQQRPAEGFLGEEVRRGRAC